MYHTDSFAANKQQHRRQQQPSLRYPIDEHERQILYLLERKQVLLVVGDTGSGKSTRIPQILFSSGCYNSILTEHTINSDIKSFRPKHRQICVTQPRRVAAIQLAQRVSQFLECDLGTTVGYTIRFQDVTSLEYTMVKFVTEGLLIRELMHEPLLEHYSVIMVDEVHERNLNTDILLGLLKCILVKRKDLKLIVCSATLEVDEISTFFINLEPGVVVVKGKSFPVRICYKKHPVANYLNASIETVRKIHESSRLGSGKILMFLTGQDEVEYVCKRLEDYALTVSNRLDIKQLLVLPFHASLRPDEISKVFDEHGRNTRACIVATNIAETSLTINGVAHVIDCGFAKLKTYDGRMGFDCLVRVPISKSSAKQRAGRTGRTCDGIVYRLYRESDYNRLRDRTVPEIQRSPLLETITLLKSLCVNDLSRFPLISRMPRKNLVESIEFLYALQAINEEGKLTSTGKLMARFNLEPKISKILVSLETSGCTQEACRVAACLQVKEIYAKSGRHANSLWSNQSLVNLCTVEGDLISYLNILNAFMNNERSQKWAERRNLNFQALLNASEIAIKLELQLKQCGVSVTSSRGRTELIQRSLCSGLFLNAAYLHPSGDYKTLRGEQTVHIHPTSVLSELIEKPKFVVFVEMLSTTKLYMRHIMAIERQWLLEAAPHYYTFGTDLEMMRNK